jgi:hypothetical protein
MRENLTYGLMWRGVETRTSVPGATPRPYQRRALRAAADAER